MMRYFKAISGEVFALDRGFEHLAPSGGTEIPEAEALALANPAPTSEQLFVLLRDERDARLAVAVAILDRHRNQVDFGLAPTLTDEQALAWATYAQALRDLPGNTADPADPEWPAVPE